MREDAARPEPRKIQHRRNQDQAIDSNALVGLQPTRDLGHAKATIAFTGQELGRGDAIVIGQPAADGRGERSDISFNAPEIFPDVIIALDAAKPRARRVKEDEVGEVEPGLGVRMKNRRR